MIKGMRMKTLVEIIFRLHVPNQHLGFDQNFNKLGFADADHDQNADLTKIEHSSPLTMC